MQAAVLCARTERPALAPVRLGRGDEYHRVAPPVHDIVSAGIDGDLTQHGEVDRSSPRFAAVIRIKQPRTPFVCVRHAQGHGKTGLREIKRLFQIPRVAARTGSRKHARGRHQVRGGFNGPGFTTIQAPGQAWFFRLRTVIRMIILLVQLEIRRAEA